MKVGFTGTRDGLTPAQGAALARFVSQLAITEFHHGCCVGADAEAVVHVAHHHPGAVIFAYPSDIQAMTHDGAYSMSDHHYPPKPPLKRNPDIVDSSELLLACPATRPEAWRSGTGSTIRYARKRRVPVVIIWPNGSIAGDVQLRRDDS